MNFYDFDPYAGSDAILNFVIALLVLFLLPTGLIWLAIYIVRTLIERDRRSEAFENLASEMLAIGNVPPAQSFASIIEPPAKAPPRTLADLGGSQEFLECRFYPFGRNHYYLNQVSPIGPTDFRIPWPPDKPIPVEATELAALRDRPECPEWARKWKDEFYIEVFNPGGETTPKVSPQVSSAPKSDPETSAPQEKPRRRDAGHRWLG